MDIVPVPVLLIDISRDAHHVVFLSYCMRACMQGGMNAVYLPIWPPLALFQDLANEIEVLLLLMSCCGRHN
jgi:hypothetical protein